MHMPGFLFTKKDVEPSCQNMISMPGQVEWLTDLLHPSQISLICG